MDGSTPCPHSRLPLIRKVVEPKLWEDKPMAASVSVGFHSPIITWWHEGRLLSWIMLLPDPMLMLVEVGVIHIQMALPKDMMGSCEMISGLARRSSGEARVRGRTCRPCTGTGSCWNHRTCWTCCWIRR